MRVVVDAGALIALESKPGTLTSQFDDLARRTGDVPLVPATVVAQIWRSGAGRQSPIASFLSAADIIPLDDVGARAVGRLLAASGTDDIVDAHVVEAATDGDVIVTSDPYDIARLAQAAAKQVAIIAI